MIAPSTLGEAGSVGVDSVGADSVGVDSVGVDSADADSVGADSVGFGSVVTVAGSVLSCFEAGSVCAFESEVTVGNESTFAKLKYSPPSSKLLSDALLLEVPQRVIISSSVVSASNCKVKEI